MFIDTFPFNKDFNALKIRLAEIGDFADLIVISESFLTHSGQFKPLYLSQNLDVLGHLRKKTEIVGPRESDLRTKNPRIREMMQRQAITKFISTLKLTSEDFIFHSDCDEIPRLTVLESIIGNGKKGNYIFELRDFANSLNLERGKWKRGRLVSIDHYRDIQQLRKDIFLDLVFQQKYLPLGFFRVPDFWTRRRIALNFPSIERNPKLTTVYNAGWHFNNLLEPKEVLDKIENSSHTELNTFELRELAHKRFLEGRDIYTGELLKKVQIDDSFPECIYSRQTEWDSFIKK